MNKKVLATAMFVMSLAPSLLFGQSYRMDIDAQAAGEQKIIDRVFTGNTIDIKASFFDGEDALAVTNWAMRFMYGLGQYDTNGMVPVVGSAGESNNIVLFQSSTNAFFAEGENYYFSVVGTNAVGQIKTFARGRMIEEYDPATGGGGGYPLPMPWGSFWFMTADDVAAMIATSEFEVVVAYGVTDASAYRGDWGHSVSGRVAIMETNKLDASTAATTYQPTGSYATGTPVYVETDSTAMGQGFATTNAAGEIATNVVGAATNALLDIAGTRAMTGDVVTLARDVKSRDATSAGEGGVALGGETVAGDYGVAIGDNNIAGNYGTAFGRKSTAGDYGVAFGYKARGSEGAFVFSDSTGEFFYRTNHPNSFNLRVAGGIYAEIGTNVFTVTDTVTMNGVELGAGGGGGGATQLIANVAGQATATSTWDAATATLTLTDLPAPEAGITPEDATNAAQAVVAAATEHGLKRILPAVVEGGAVTIWAESNAWWDVDCSVNVVTAAVPWVINTNGWTSGELPIVGVVIRRGTNTFALPAGAVTNSAMPAASTTNAYVLWNNGTDWVFE